MRDNAWLGFSNGGARNFPDSTPARSSGGFTRMDVGPVFNLEDMLRKQVLVTNEINFQFGFLLSNNKTYDPDVCHGGNFSKDFYKLKKSYHESTF